jgi:hypothetical protein
MISGPACSLSQLLIERSFLAVTLCAPVDLHADSSPRPFVFPAPDRACPARAAHYAADAATGTVIYGYVLDSCADDNYWCRKDEFHVDLSQPYLQSLGLLGNGGSWNGRKLSWNFIPDTPEGCAARRCVHLDGYVLSPPLPALPLSLVRPAVNIARTAWPPAPPASSVTPARCGFRWTQNEIKFSFKGGSNAHWATFAIIGTSNGIGSVKQQVGGQWKECSRFLHLGAMWTLTDTAGDTVTIQVNDVAGQPYGTYNIPYPCSNGCSADTQPTAF